MFFLLFFALLLGSFFSYFYGSILYLSLDLQSHCLQLSPQSDQQEVYYALICGKADYGREFVKQWRQLGLLHLLIVSGLHLQFFVKLLRPIPLAGKRPLLLALMSFSFVMVCGLKTAILRAWIELVARQLNKGFSLHMHQLDLLLVSILFCLSANPHLINSYSLILSWLACLALKMAKQSLAKNFLCLTLSLPLLLQLQCFSIWLAPLNIVVTPVIGQLVFPLCLLSFVHPIFQNLCDPLLNFLSHCNEILIANYTKPVPLDFSIPPLHLWLYTSLLHGLGRFFSRKA